MRWKIFVEISRCSFCGFCEHACPTLNYGDFRRQYGPRGRIQAILFALRENLISPETIRGVYTCLECNACSLHCPAKINIAEIIRKFRYLVSSGSITPRPKVRKLMPIIQ